MLVQPSLPDHPKFLRLREQLGPVAMEVLIRLWAFCQNARTAQLGGVDANFLKAICRYPGRAERLWTALTTPQVAGKKAWIDISDKNGALVHDFEFWNKNLRSARENGRFGGDPHSPRATPRATPRGGRPAGNEGMDENEGMDVVAAEVPSEEEILEVAVGYGGDLATGIPPGIPKGWALSWYAWRCSPSAGPFPVDWRDDLVRRFRADWQSGIRGARGRNFEKNAAGGRRETGEILQEITAARKAGDVVRVLELQGELK